MKLENGKPDKDMAWELEKIQRFEKLYRYAEKIGFNYSWDIMDILHNEIALRTQYIETQTNYEVLITIWKDGTVHAYDRKKYCEHRYGKKGV